MRVAFFGHNQPVDRSVRPSGGYLAKDDADRLVRELIAERVSQKVIRAFAPDSQLRRLATPRPYMVNKLPAVDLPGLRFEQPLSQPARRMSLVRWHWAHSEQQLSAAAGY